METLKKKGYSENKYLIAGIRTQMLLKENGKTKAQAQEYISDFSEEAELFIGLRDDFLEKKQQENPHLTKDECEYIFTGEFFCKNLISFGGFMLHASAVVYEGRAYLFSAPSGTGKSTHTRLWQQTFGEDKTYILNDDKPAIRLLGDEIIVCGTPWSGKTDKNKNKGVPLAGICFLERAEENSIKKLDEKTAIFEILNQTIRPKQKEEMAHLLILIGEVLKKTNVYKMGCNISTHAVYTAYNEMSKG